MRRPIRVAALILGTTLALAAFTGVSGAASDDEVANAKEQLAKNYKGTDRALPTSAPEPEAGKNVWVIASATAAEGSAIPAEAIKDAGSRIDWDVTVFDGQFTPTVQSEGIRSAIADGADAIVIVAVDCPNVSNALQEAKGAGITLYSNFSLDCNEGPGQEDGPEYLDAHASFDKQRSPYSSYLKNVRARTAVDWVTAKTAGKANVLLADQTDLINAQIETNAFKKLFAKKCPDCTVSTVEFTGPDLLSGDLRNIVAAALAKDPDVDVVVAPYDASISLGIGPAVEQTGRDILLVGYEGLTANMTEIKKGGPTNLSTGFPSQWVGWQTIDELNRLFHGEDLVDEGMGYQTVDKTHNVPSKTTFYDGNVATNGAPKQDYEKNFLSIWGVN